MNRWQVLKRLLVGANQRVSPVVDGHFLRWSRAVRDFAASTAGRLPLLFLPPYLPQVNPDEPEWNAVQNQRVGRAAIRTRHDPKRVLVSAVCGSLGAGRCRPLSDKGEYRNAAPALDLTPLLAAFAPWWKAIPHENWRP